MQIIIIDRKGNQFTEKAFFSFKEVFDFCLDDLKNRTPIKDDILYRFKILDSNEIFTLHGTPNGDDSELYTEINFR